VDTRSGKRLVGSLTIGLGLIILFFIVGLISATNSQDTGRPAAEQAIGSVAPGQASPPQPAVETAPTAPAPPTRPADEQQFIRAVQESRTAFQQAANEMAQGGTRALRRERICQDLTGLEVSGWVSQINKLGSNSDGKGVLEVSLADGVTLATWNNDLSDISDNTLINPASPLFQSLAQMKVGDQVTFSGSFAPSDVDCVREASMTLSGSMTDPDFVFRFSSVSPR
jgi:hypothetical protein